MQPFKGPPTHPSVTFPAALSTWNQCPPLLLATSFKPSASIPSSRQPPLLPPVLILAESSLGPHHHLAKGQAHRTGPATPRGQLGTLSFPGDGQRPARPSAPGDPAYLSCQLTSGSPLQGQFDFYLLGPAPAHPSNSPLKPWAASADAKASYSPSIQHLLSPTCLSPRCGKIRPPCSSVQRHSFLAGAPHPAPQAGVSAEPLAKHSTRPQGVLFTCW